jgi:transposase
MYRVSLTEEQRQELHRRIRQAHQAARTRERLEMVRLSEAGWSVPRIALHLQQHEQTVRRWIKTYLSDGFDALCDQPHTGQKSAITKDILAQVRAWLAQGEWTWNAVQIAQEVAQRYGMRRSPRQWRQLLRRENLSYKRTKRTLRHKQKPEEVAAKRADLETLEKGALLDCSTCAISTRPVLR